MVLCKILYDIFLLENTPTVSYIIMYMRILLTCCGFSVIKPSRMMDLDVLQCVLCVSERTTSYTRYRKNLIQFSSRLSAPRSKLMFAFHAALPLCCIRVQTCCMHAASHRLSAAPRCLRFHYIQYIPPYRVSLLIYWHRY